MCRSYTSLDDAWQRGTQTDFMLWYIGQVVGGEPWSVGRGDVFDVCVPILAMVEPWLSDDAKELLIEVSGFFAFGRPESERKQLQRRSRALMKVSPTEDPVVSCAIKAAAYACSLLYTDVCGVCAANVVGEVDATFMTAAAVYGQNAWSVFWCDKKAFDQEIEGVIAGANRVSAITLKLVGEIVREKYPSPPLCAHLSPDHYSAA